jgi:chitinase
MGYYASWKASQYPTDAIEWSGLTHIAMAFYLPNQDGSLSLLGGNPEVASEVVSAAHAHGVLAVASIGGADSADGFRQATASSTLEAFLTHLLALLQEDGYDDIDID